MIGGELSDKVIALETENALGKVIRSHRKSREKVFILFLSKWDNSCVDLVNNILGKYSRRPKVYLVDSWTCAKAFVTYKSYFGIITETPTLVILSPGAPRVEDYLPNIYRMLEVG
mgnify:CR=1 FL=1